MLSSESQEQGPRAGRRAVRHHFGDDTGGPSSSIVGAASALVPASERSNSRRVDIQKQEQQEQQQDPTSALEQPAGSPKAAGRKVGFDASALEKSERDELAPVSRDGGRKFVGMSRRKQQQLQSSDSSRTRSKYDELEHTTEVMEIPELQEDGKEDITRVVAQAPRERLVRVAQLSELQDEVPLVLHVAGGQGSRDIDLSLLTSFLCAYDQVQEEDEIWDPEQLLADVASAIHADREQGRGRTESSSELRPLPA